MDQFITNLQDSLQRPLPGRSAQYEMAHAVRRTPYEPPVNANKAGVLALFYPKQDDWHIVLIERGSGNPKDRHKGQISFPGGRYEEADGDLAMTALREAEEEVGADAKSVHLLGALTDLYIPVSNFMVYPYVGYTEERPKFVPQASEVHAILEVPYRQLQDPETVHQIDLKITDQITLREVPYFNVEGKVIWGATAMMLNELITLTRQT
jgi:8-oxo-dGTP pyrophosphatase MutT (NUDIX family)